MMMTSELTTVKIVRGERVAPTVYDNYPRCSSYTRGTLQIFCGAVILILCGVIVVNGANEFAQGIQLPITAIIAGSFGIASGRSKTTCKIATDLVLSIMSAITSCALFALSAIWLALLDQMSYAGVNRDRVNDALNDGRAIKANVSGLYGPMVGMLIFSLIESIVAISSAVTACHFVCFCCKKCCCLYDVTTTDQMQMYQSEQQQPLNQDVAGRNGAPVDYRYQMATQKSNVMPPSYDCA